MAKMSLIMENWRAFRLVENEAPNFKEDPKDTVALVAKLATETDPGKKEAATRALALDKDVAPVAAALGELFQHLASEEIEEGIEQTYDDLTAAGSGIALDAASKISEFLESSQAGRILKKASGPLLGLALMAFVLQQPGESGNVKKSAEAISQLITNPDVGEGLAGAADVAMGLATESLRNRKKN